MQRRYRHRIERESIDRRAPLDEQPHRTEAAEIRGKVKRREAVLGDCLGGFRILIESLPEGDHISERRRLEHIQQRERPGDAMRLGAVARIEHAQNCRFHARSNTSASSGSETSYR